jgi:redox-sensitive bicupin YhaK (pirin superfamily)
MRRDGAVNRAVVGDVPGSGLDRLGPFLGLIHALISPRGTYPMHPHRGLEIITYVLKGTVRHEDSLGHSAVLTAGGAEWLLAGKGVAHASVPLGDEVLDGLQLLAESPAPDRQLEPVSAVFAPGDLPVVGGDGATVRVVAGELGGRLSPLRPRVPMLYLDVTLAAGRRLELPAPATSQGLVYVLAGGGRFGAPAVRAGAYERLLLGIGEGLTVEAGDVPVRFILLASGPYP